MSQSVRSPVRVTPAFFFLLLTLVDGDAHGYAMAREVEERSGGSVRLGPGSLYWSLSRLQSVGLIAETSPAEGQGDARRRYYRLTDLGRRVLQQEVDVLSRVVDYARDKRVV